MFNHVTESIYFITYTLNNQLNYILMKTLNIPTLYMEI